MGLYEAVTEAVFTKVKSEGFTDWKGDILPIVWPDKDLKDTEKPKGSYLRCHLSETQPDKYVVEAGDCGTLYIWILHVDLVVKNNMGAVKPKRVTDQIVKAFQDSSTFGTTEAGLKVYDPPRVAPGVPSGATVTHPVQIRIMNTDSDLSDDVNTAPLDDFLMRFETVDW